MGLFRRKQAGLTRQQSLSAIPVPNRNVEVEKDDAGNVTITVPWQRNWKMTLIGLLMLTPPAKRKRVVALDEVGSEVYSLCDGRRTMKSIVDIFADRYKLSRKEAVLSITAYLNQLAQRGIVAFMVPQAERSRGAGSARRATRRGRRKDASP